MQLQLEDKNLTCMKLTITGSVGISDAQVLRAGFRNLLKRARTSFLIDLTQASISASAEFPLLETQADAIVSKIRLVLIGSNARVCQAKTLKDAQDLLPSVVRLDKVLVPQLYELQKHYYLRTDKAAGLLSSRPLNHYELLLEENRRLIERVGEFELEIKELLKDYIPPVDLGALAVERQSWEDKVHAALTARRFFQDGEEAP
jgi:hypothetical protein